MIFCKVIIDRKKKLAMRKVHKEDFTTVLALIAITVTSSSDKHYKEPMFLHLRYSSRASLHKIACTHTSTRRIFKSARELLASARASLAESLLKSYLRVHAYCTSAKYSRAFVHART